MVELWSDAELETLRTLVAKCRVMTADQLAHAWSALPDAPTTDVADFLERLLGAGLIEQKTVSATSPLPDVTNPLFAWQPGQSPPSAARLSDLACSRFNQPQTEVALITPSKVSANLFAVPPDLPPAADVNRLLLLASVYLRYLTNEPKLAALWSPAHVRPPARNREKNLHVTLSGNDGKLVRVIQCTPRNPKQIDSLHVYCSSLRTPYELW